MAKVAISLDEDKDEALKFLKDKIQPQVLHKEKGKLDVIGKTHL